MAPRIEGPAFLFWPFHVVRDYLRQLQGQLPPDVLARWAALNEALERLQPPLPLIFGHNDLLPANFLDDGVRLWLIDFEYAGFGTCLFDLAGAASNAGMTADQARALIRAYLGAAPDAAFLRAFDAMQVASLLREMLWAHVSALHLSAPGVNYATYADEERRQNGHGARPFSISTRIAHMTLPSTRKSSSLAAASSAVPPPITWRAITRRRCCSLNKAGSPRGQPGTRRDLSGNCARQLDHEGTEVFGGSVQAAGCRNGLATGWKMTGCLRLATTADRWTEFRRLATTARSFGMEMDLLSAAEVKRMWPLMETSDLIGASWLPTDGQASPSDIAQSLAKGARMAGAQIVEGVRVTGFRKDGARITHVLTNQGDVACDTVVNCAGMWAREVGALAGITVPLQAVKTPIHCNRTDSGPGGRRSHPA